MQPFWILLAAVVGASAAALYSYVREWIMERGHVRIALYHELANRAGRCLNDYIAPWARVHDDAHHEDINGLRLAKFRPSLPVIYPALGAKLALLDSGALAAIIEFYFRLDAVRRDIDRIPPAAHADPLNDSIKYEIARRIGETLWPALSALDLLGKRSRPELMLSAIWLLQKFNTNQIDQQVARSYGQIRRDGVGLRDGLRKWATAADAIEEHVRDEIDEHAELLR